MSFGEKPSSDDLPVTISRTETYSDLANASPPLRNRSEIQIGKAPPLRPYSGIKNADDDVRTIVRFGPEASLVS
ncbi:hypothetical protein HanRHA438_Chr17g0815131 [Helianthus annuus]|nr:hypothetical protein HanRHA438_Chr17g0815131 [Helianthus annuus]